MSNLGRAFLELLPAQPLFVAQVTAVNADGTSTVEFPNGSTLIVLGTLVGAGSYAFIRNRTVIAEAPAVSPITLDLPVLPATPQYILATSGAQIIAPSGGDLLYA